MTPAPHALWAFARPHTVIGTALSVAGLWAIAVAEGGAADPAPLLLAWAACLAANVFIVGLNQLTDLDIDRINKPELPLPSGQLSVPAARAIVWGCLAASLVLAWWAGPWLLAAVALSDAIGAAYSLPPVRLKRFALWAAACIFVVRGVVVNVLIFVHFLAVLAGRVAVPASVWVLTAFVVVFSLVIAWLKDVPDMEGDRAFGIRTLSLRLGARRVFALGVGALSAAYVAMMGAGWVGVPGVDSGALIAGHGLLLAVALWAARRVDVGNRAQVRRFYLTVWVLFFAEYIVFPLACLLA